MTPAVTRGMTETTRRVARAVLRRAAGDSTWGQAILAELDEIHGTWAIIRWTAGGLRVSWRQRPSRARRLVLATACALALAALANQFVVTLRFMPSGAMEPTVPLGSRVVVDKAAFRLAGLHHGDLFVLWMAGPHGQRFSLVSRLIGLPGDRIECRDGAVLRNGTAISEPYVMADSITDCAPHVVADGTVYVLSDHRRAAMDSRRGGAVPIDDLVGRVILTL